LTQVTDEEFITILDAVSKTNKKVDFTAERNILKPSKDYRATGGFVGGSSPSGSVAGSSTGGSSTQDSADSAKDSADQKTSLQGVDFLKELLKTNPLLAALLFILVVIAGLATANADFPQIGTILLWVCAFAVVGIIATAVRNFLKGSALSPVSAYYAAIQYAKQQDPNKDYAALNPPPAKLNRTCWTLSLKCGGEAKGFLVGFDGKVIPRA
jgi:hypothetical protein